MGLLDDAIREHLELKRRGGADPAEVARLEREAFGAQEQAASENGNGQRAHAEPGQADELVPDRGSGHVDISDAPHPDEHVHEPAAVGDALVEPEPLVQEPPAPEPAAPAQEREPVEQPTRQFTAAELDDAQRPHHGDEAPDRADTPDEDSEAHDELEDTPDFLQETPEHDRLWFEQKPPRDFDF